MSHFATFLPSSKLERSELIWSSNIIKFWCESSNETFWMIFKHCVAHAKWTRPRRLRLTPRRPKKTLNVTTNNTFWKMSLVYHERFALFKIMTRWSNFNGTQLWTLKLYFEWSVRAKRELRCSLSLRLKLVWNHRTSKEIPQVVEFSKVSNAWPTNFGRLD